jgi:hypothetical protein
VSAACMGEPYGLSRELRAGRSFDQRKPHTAVNNRQWLEVSGAPLVIFIPAL